MMKKLGEVLIVFLFDYILAPIGLPYSRLIRCWEWVSDPRAELYWLREKRRLFKNAVPATAEELARADERLGIPPGATPAERNKIILAHLQKRVAARNIDKTQIVSSGISNNLPDGVI